MNRYVPPNCSSISSTPSAAAKVSAITSCSRASETRARNPVRGLVEDRPGPKRRREPASRHRGDAPHAGGRGDRGAHGYRRGGRHYNGNGFGLAHGTHSIAILTAL